MLLAPPHALPALGPGSGGSGSSYGDAVRITSRLQPSTDGAAISIGVIARLHPLLPAAVSCRCAARCSGDDGDGSSYTVVLPRRILVALPSSGPDAGAAAATTELVLPAAFEARIEVLPYFR